MSSRDSSANLSTLPISTDTLMLNIGYKQKTHANKAKFEMINLPVTKKKQKKSGKRKSSEQFLDLLTFYLFELTLNIK